MPPRLCDNHGSALGPKNCPIPEFKVEQGGRVHLEPSPLLPCSLLQTAEGTRREREGECCKLQGYIDRSNFCDQSPLKSKSNSRLFRILYTKKWMPYIMNDGYNLITGLVFPTVWPVKTMTNPVCKGGFIRLQNGFHFWGEIWVWQQVLTTRGQQKLSPSSGEKLAVRFRFPLKNEPVFSRDETTSGCNTVAILVAMQFSSLLPLKESGRKEGERGRIKVALSLLAPSWILEWDNFWPECASCVYIYRVAHQVRPKILLTWNGFRANSSRFKAALSE